MRWLPGACLGLCIVAGSLSQAGRAKDGQAPDGKTGAQTLGPVAVARVAKERKPAARANRDVTLRGTVIDKATRKPIENAAVARLKRVQIGPVGDRDHTVRTDKQGRFELPPSDMSEGYEASHDDYESFRFTERPWLHEKVARPSEVTIELQAKMRETIRGTIKSPDGKPLAGVKISDQTKSYAESNTDGSFTIACGKAGRNPYKLEFVVPGYFAQTVTLHEVPAEALAVVLKPVYQLAWRVVSPEGKPVPRLTFFIGPGKNPAWYECDDTKVDSPQGEIRARVGEVHGRGTAYSQEVGESHEFWICVRAPGYAVWEDVVTADDLTKPRTVQLKPGATVSGSVVPPAAGIKKVRAILKPQRENVEPMFSQSEAASRRFGEVGADVGPDGVFRLEHVRPDAYTLEVSGESIAPINRLVVVPDAGVRLEPMKAEGTGRVFGQTTIISAGSSKPGISLGSYAQWGIRHPAWGRDYDRDIHFQADREGRFSIDGVPAGLVTVYLNTRGLHADIVRTRTRAAQVVEGQATEVRFFDSSGEWDLPLEFVVDGSEKQFQSGTGRGPSPSSKSHPQDKPEPLRFTVRLEAKPGQRLSYPPEEEVSIPGFNNRRTVVHDVSPGKYRLVVFHRDDAIRYRASGVPAFEADIDFKSQGPPIRVNLVGK